MMNHLKDHVKATTKCMHFLTYADNYAIGYFKKQVRPSELRAHPARAVLNFGLAARPGVYEGDPTRPQRVGGLHQGLRRRYYHACAFQQSRFSACCRLFSDLLSAFRVQCSMLPRIKYLDVSTILAQQKEVGTLGLRCVHAGAT